jgi:hypothetical protein
MPATAIPIRPVPLDSGPDPVPKIPLVVLASGKGGVGKTALAVGLSERLGYAGLTVLLMTSDRQEDGRRRLGVPPSSAPQVVVERGPGRIAVAGLAGPKAIDLLFRSGPEKLKDFDLAILDTRASLTAGRVPGATVIAPVDGRDAMLNAVVLLRGMPASSEVIFVRHGAADAEGWAADVDAMGKAAGREPKYVAQPIPIDPRIAEAHNAGVSILALARRGRVRQVVGVIETLAAAVWAKVKPGLPIPKLPPPSASSVYVEGWDDAEAP